MEATPSTDASELRQRKSTRESKVTDLKTKMTDDKEVESLISNSQNGQRYSDNGGLSSVIESDRDPLVPQSSDEEEGGEVRVASPVLNVEEIENESSWQIGLQVFFPYMIAGFGMVAAGLVLDVVQVCFVDSLLHNRFKACLFIFLSWVTSQGARVVYCFGVLIYYYYQLLID